MLQLKLMAFGTGAFRRRQTAEEQGAISGKYLVKTGEVIYSKIRPALRKAVIAPCDCLCGADMYPLRPSKELVPGYLLRVLLSPRVTRYLADCSMRVAMPKVNREAMGDLWLCYPDKKTQTDILTTLSVELRPLDAAIQKAMTETNLVREYRTRLITDVVTGKVDVRQVAATAATSTVAEAKPAQAKRTANVYFRRSVFAAEIVQRLHKEPTFGHVKCEKLIFLCEKRCGVDIGSTYHRQAAGPYDNRALRSIDSQLQKQHWYKARKGDKGYRYVPLEKAGAHKEYFDRHFGDVMTRFDEIIDTFRAMNTQRCEIVATLYAAWEDLLPHGDVTDDQIIEQVLYHWHPDKQKIAEDRWRRALGWMKTKGLTPETRGDKPELVEGAADDG